MNRPDETPREAQPEASVKSTDAGTAPGEPGAAVPPAAPVRVPSGEAFWKAVARFQKLR